MKRNWIILGVIVAAVLLTGCGTQKREPVSIEKIPYERMNYQTVEVQRGDLNPEVTVTLKAEEYELLIYSMADPQLELDKVCVSVGDKVQEGDLLVAFKSGEIEEKMAGYEEEIAQMKLMIEHYSNLMRIDPELDYSEDLRQMNEDLYVKQLYLEEEQAKLEGYQIRAKRSGTIKEIDEYLKSGYYQPGNDLITEACGTEDYTAETDAPELFSQGESYTAYCGAVGYEVRLKEIKGNVLTFEAVSDMSSVLEGDTPTITVYGEPLHDVLYVDKNAVHQMENASFVYVLGEDDYRSVVWVRTGARSGNDWVIEEGLSEGEKVTLD